MADARPLQELLADLVGDAEARHAHDPATYLAAHGHPDLPAELVAEAVVSYADTAPPDVAEHLAPFVMSHSVVPTEPAESDWFDLLTTAPLDQEADDDLAEDSMLDDLPAEPSWDGGDLGPDPAALDFGTGSFAPVAPPEAPVDLDAPDTGVPADLPSTSAAGEQSWAAIEREPAVLGEETLDQETGPDGEPDSDDDSLD